MFMLQRKLPDICISPLSLAYIQQLYKLLFIYWVDIKIATDHSGLPLKISRSTTIILSWILLDLHLLLILFLLIVGWDIECLFGGRIVYLLSVLSEH